MRGSIVTPGAGSKAVSVSGPNENCSLDDNLPAASSVTEYQPYQIIKTPYRNGFLLELQVHDHLSEFYLKAASSANPLPVTLVYFKADRQGKNARLDWQTALEENNAGFDVEVSEDMAQFRKLGFVTGKGSNSKYQFTDTEAGKQNTRYYRLKQLDTDGTISYSPIRAVNFGAEAVPVQVWPNPFYNQLTVQLHAADAGKAALQLTDVLGRKVLQQQVLVKAGLQTIELQLPEQLANGIYLLQVQQNQQKNVLKVVKN